MSRTLGYGNPPSGEPSSGSDGGNGHRSDDYWRHPGNASADMVLIHVIDEHRKLNKHYCCKRQLMLSHMRYFAEYLTEDKAYDDVDISVHCDSDIFEWLLTYIHDPSNPPPLDKTRVVSVLISSEFLLMDPLVELCLDFFAANLTEVIRLPIDLSCLTDRALKGLAQRCPADRLAAAKDKKGKLLHKLFKRRAEIDFSSREAADLVQCCRCGLVYPNEAAQHLACPNASVVIEADGSLVRRHERVKPSQWSLFEHVRALQQMPLSWECIYWYLWAACLVIRGQHAAVSALQVDRYVVDDVTISIQQPTYTARSGASRNDIPRFRLNSDVCAGVVQDQVDAATFGLRNITLLRSQHKHIAAAYAASQELFRKQAVTLEQHNSRSATPASLDHDIDDSSDSTTHAPDPTLSLPSAPQGSTLPERPLSRERSKRRDSLHRGRMRPMSADKSAAVVAPAAVVAAAPRPESAQRGNRVPRAPAQPRRRSRSLSSGFVQRLESSLSLQQAAEQELARSFDIFNQVLDAPAGAPKPLHGVFIGPHPLSQMPKAYFSSLRKAQSSNQLDEKRIQWEMDLLREFDEKRLAELQHKIAQARKAFQASGGSSSRQIPQS